MNLRLSLSAVALATLALGVSIAGCGGGGSGGGTGGPPPTVAPSATPIPAPASATQNVTLGATQQSAPFGPLSSGVSGTVTVPVPQSGSGTITLVEQAAQPSGAPVPAKALSASARSHILALGGTVTPLLFVSFTPTSTVSFASNPGFSLTFPAGTLAGNVYLIIYNPANQAAGWNVLSGPVPGTGTTVTFPVGAAGNAQSIPAGSTVYFAVVETGTPLPTPTPVPTPTPTPTSSPTPGTSPTPQPGTGTALAPPATNPHGGWAPYATANTLKFPVQSGYNGAGQTVGIIIDAQPLQSDVTAYLLQYGITQTGSLTFVPVDGGSTTAPSGEETLDTETVAGLAPGANVIVYVVPNLSGLHISDAYSLAETAGVASVINLSFGGCESTYDQTTNAPLFAAASQKGMVFVASSGDQGDSCFNGTGQTYGVGYPASDPNAIGVGGNENLTPTNAMGTIDSTVAWNDLFFGNSGGQGATGGGVSTRFAIPTFQQGSIPGSFGSTAFRNVPDVALPAEDVAVYLNGAWGAFSGTSWSAPQFAALVAEIDEYCNAHISNAASLYAAYTKTSADFIDVTSGTNAYTGISGISYTAGTGYDNLTGLGLPLGMPLAQTLCPNRVPAGPLVSRVPTAMFEQTRPHVARQVAPVENLANMQDLGLRQAAQVTKVAIGVQSGPAIASHANAIVNALRNAGMTVTYVASDNLLIDAQGPASVVASFFSTTIHNVNQPRYGMRYANVTPVIAPASIAPYISGMITNNLIRYQRVSHRIKTIGSR